MSILSKIEHFAPVGGGKLEENPRIFLNLREASTFLVGLILSKIDQKWPGFWRQIICSKPI